MPCCVHDVREIHCVQPDVHWQIKHYQTTSQLIHIFSNSNFGETRTGILDLFGRNWKDESGGGRKKNLFGSILKERIILFNFYGVSEEEPPVCRCSYTLVITVYESSLITFRRLTKAMKVNNNLSPPFKYLFHFRPSDWKSTGSLRRLVYVPEIVIIGDGRPMTRRIRVMAEDIDNNTILFYKLGGRVGIFLLRFLNVIILCIGYQDFTFIQYTTYSSLLL